MTTLYGDITPRTAAFAQKELLKRALPFLNIEKFGQGRPVPSNSTKVTKFRRFEALDSTPKTLSEGVTPSANTLTVTDVTATLVQYGDRIVISDVIQDTHEDPVFSEAQTILGEQAGQMIERIRWGVIKAGTNVVYGNGVADRASVVTSISAGDLRLVVRTLKRQNAMPFTSMLKSSPNWGSQALPRCYVAFCHPDLEPDLRALTGFKPVEDYGSATPISDAEIGAFGYLRFITSTLYEPLAGANGTTAAVSTTGLLNTGGYIDLYPIVIVGQNSYGIVPLKGKSAADIMVVNPKPSDSDPLAQRGHVGWKTMQTACVLNDAFMVRLEVGVKSTPA